MTNSGDCAIYRAQIEYQYFSFLVVAKLKLLYLTDF